MIVEAQQRLPLVRASTSIRDTIAAIDEFAKGIALVVDDEGRLDATITDGDIRRTLLAGLSLEQPVSDLLALRSPSESVPKTAPVGTPESRLLAMMNAHGVRHVPIVDRDGRVVELAALTDFVRELELPLTAVVMAGGFGRRLGQLTEDLPKPMLPVGDRPLLERIIDQLRDAGIRSVNLTTHYRGEAIATHFGDGRRFGVDIRYVNEDEPLGTAGALGLLEDMVEPILVMNGDILTRVSFRAMLEFHDDHDADMTMAVRPYEVSVPYGVVETDGADVVGIVEKPLVSGFVNAGIYLLSARACREVPKGEHHEMPELVRGLVAKGFRVVGFPLREYWLDIGQLDDYQQALLDYAESQ